MIKRSRPVMDGIRWAFKLTDWQPTQEQWMFAAQCVQPEEKDRIGKFVFQKDSKSALVGRILLRRAVHQCVGVPYRDIHLARTDKGKPFLVNNTECKDFNFNISHQGDYAVLGAEPSHKIGVDVMQIEQPKGSRTVHDFFDNMKRQFTTSEWEIIREPIDEWDQLKHFYRFWCLKESYVKALGVGIGFSLQRLDFCPQSDLEKGDTTCDTRVYVDEELQKHWKFEETLLDNKHCVSVALKRNGDESLPAEGRVFQLFSFNELISGAEPLTSSDLQYWSNYSAKQYKPNLQK